MSFKILALVAMALAVASAQDTYYYNEATGETTYDFPQWYQVDAAGNYYYVDPATGQSSYTLPADYAWSSLMDQYGGYYYSNSVTGQTTYDKPRHLAWKVMSSYWVNEAMGHSQYETPVWELTDDAGYKYYIDPYTQQTTYEKPEAYSWETYTDASGYPYYYNAKTGLTSYETPWFLTWKQVATEV